MRILLVDDHPVVLRGLRALLLEEFPGVEIGEATDGDQALTQLERSSWSAVVLDLAMPGRQGLDLLCAIKEQWKSVPVLVLSQYPEEHYAVRALRAGASGYLNKHAVPTQLAQALRKILGGGRYVTEAVADRMVGLLGGEAKTGDHEALSNREFDVLRGIGAGKTVGQIARELHLSVKTVSTYRSRLLEKMGLSSNAELTRYVVERRLA